MYTILTVGLITMTITTDVMLLASLLSKKKKKKTIIDREKSSPFECGFDPKSSPRTPFSIRFFLIAVIFLIFDVEIVLLLPAAITLTTAMIMPWTIVTMTFLLILLIGLYHEWNQGSLEWPA